MKNENNIAGRLERLPLSKAHWKIWLVHEILWILGSVGLGTTTFVLSNVATEFGLDGATKGLIATLTFLGMFVGASTAGMLSDKLGRKRMLLIAIVTWSIPALVISFTSNLMVFWIMRFMIGVGMGAHFPQTQSMLAELFPAKARGRAICLLEGGYPLAVILAGIIGWTLQMFFTWRAVFLVQGLMGLCFFLAKFGVLESARFYESKGDLVKAKEVVENIESRVMKAEGLSELPEIPDPIVVATKKSNKSTFAQLFETSDQTKKTLSMWILWFCVLFGHYGLNTWIADLLVGKGFDVVKSNGFVILMLLPAIPGYLIATYLVEIVGRKKMIFSYLVLAAVFSYLYGGANTMTTLVIFGSLLQLFNFGIWSLIYTYASEVFPTRIRATGTGTTSSAGRLAALIAPTLFGFIMQQGYPSSYIFIIASAVFLFGAVSTMVLGTETMGRSVEEIAR